MYSNLDLISDIWSYLKPYKAKFFFASFCRILADIVWLYPAYALSKVVTYFSTYSPGNSLQPVYTLMGALIVAIVIRMAGIFYAKRNCYSVGEKIAIDAEMRAIRQMMLLDISWHEKENTGNKFKRIDRGASSLNLILGMWINNVIEIITNFIGIIFIILKFDLGIGASVIFFLCTFYVLSRYYIKRGVRAANIVNEKEEHISGLIFETINNIRSIKVMSMMPRILGILKAAQADIYESIKIRISWFQKGSTFRSLYAEAFRFVAILYIIFGIAHGKYEVGFLILFSGYFSNVWQSMNELTGVEQSFTIAKQAVFRMQTTVKTPITIDREDNKVGFKEDWQKITFKNITFSYGNKLVLDNISFDIKRGERIGIVGLSGAGKSTIFKLLLKEHESYVGEILFDDVPLRDTSKKAYFNHLAVVLQDTELFNNTLRENITITNSKEEHNEELLQKSIEIAHVKDFMDKLPQGMNTTIGEKGVKLSGGEKQRIGIARAVFKNPQILLLDEATSHLDVESEEKIRDSLHRFFETVTAVVIAHRLTTIKEMDRIIVLEGGKIIESGTFNSLYKKKGRFYELWKKQKL